MYQKNSSSQHFIRRIGTHHVDFRHIFISINFQVTPWQYQLKVYAFMRNEGRNNDFPQCLSHHFTQYSKIEELISYIKVKYVMQNVCCCIVSKPVCAISKITFDGNKIIPYYHNRKYNTYCKSSEINGALLPILDELLMRMMVILMFYYGILWWDTSI